MAMLLAQDSAPRAASGMPHYGLGMRIADLPPSRGHGRRTHPRRLLMESQSSFAFLLPLWLIGAPLVLAVIERMSLGKTTHGDADERNVQRPSMQAATAQR
jgi:hypothetical protein